MGIRNRGAGSCGTGAEGHGMKSQIVGLKSLCGLKGLVRKRALLAVCEMDAQPWMSSSRVGLGAGIVLTVTRADALRLQIRRVNMKDHRDRLLDSLEQTASQAVSWRWRVANGATHRPDLGVRAGGVLEVRGA